ncbi:MAG: acetyl-CoA carboxylase biotin carboxylase subunit [Deltaproteobacteria bacterium]|nr:MAG: acetyl-CoA carboxylase biotin carboxylase subunit [Deltaproteobacteria bacterium]
MFSRILVANRGEIAVRVIRACREMGIETVAVYSDVDRHALHVRYADYAYRLGPAPASESYLNMEKIIEVARKSGAQAIHPGYGFLAENAEFAKRLEEEGIKLIGPSSEAMRVMGSKTLARQTVTKAGVPVIPGTLEPLATEEEVVETAREIGYPVMLKAAAGGGGKGMRLVRDESEILSALRMARSEAKSSFGDDSVYIEKYIEKPRHVEIQILADSHGNVVHLFERECSIQRRHQKVIEESPSPFIDDETRKRMGEVAVAAARAVNYENAGTVEFLVDADKNFYFLEMNTRLQVEHPVTEMVTGIDIVKEQIRIAAGEPLSFTQEQVRQVGHAIECRIYAEDPDRNFFPCPGLIERLRTPGGPGVRDDSGVFEGFEIPMHYDPMISKLIVWGKDRAEAIARMKRALSEYVITGVKTTIPFHIRVMNNRHFIEGDFDTNFIDKVFFKEEAERELPEPEVAMLAGAIERFRRELRESLRSKEISGEGIGSLWKYTYRPGFGKKF